MKESVKKLSEMILQCERIVFFGGAGVSTESGVKDYRSEDGLYQTVKEYGVSPSEYKRTSLPSATGVKGGNITTETL